MFEGDNIVDARIRTIDRNRCGGIIVFSTGVNSMGGKSFTDRVNNWFRANRIRLGVNLILAGAAQAGGAASASVRKDRWPVFGWSIGNFFKGRYVGPGSIYDEKSKAIELLDISNEVLEEIGTEIARAFNQREVLVKSHNTGDIWVVDQEPPGSYEKIVPEHNWD